MHDPAVARDVHIADALAGLSVPALRGASVIADLGSGAGIPGLVLAGALPHARVWLIETVRRTSGDERNQARAHLVELFDVVGADDPRVGKARMQLASALF